LLESLNLAQVLDAFRRLNAILWVTELYVQEKAVQIRYIHKNVLLIVVSPSGNICSGLFFNKLIINSLCILYFVFAVFL